MTEQIKKFKKIINISIIVILAIVVTYFISINLNTPKNEIQGLIISAISSI